MANKYKNSKIYKITSLQTDRIYIGSTVKHLWQRFSDHKTDHKRYLEGKNKFVYSSEILQFNDAKIELLESFICNNREELREREQHFINIFAEICVNKLNAYRTPEQLKQQHGDAQKAYYAKNKVRLLEEGKELTKKWREANKDKIKDKRSQKYDCECGKQSTVLHKSRHDKSAKHLAYLATKE
jgi:hypothetical protein